MHQYTADIANRVAFKHDTHLVTGAFYPRDRYSSKIAIHAKSRQETTGLAFESLRIDRLNDIRRAILAIGPDVVHLTGPHLWNVPIVLSLNIKRIPTVHTIHDMDPHQGTRLATLLPLWNKTIVSRVDHVVVHGERYTRRLVSSGTSSDKVSYWPLLFSFWGHELDWKAKEVSLDVAYKPFILFFGRLEEYKGVSTLLEAYSRLRRNWPDGEIVPELILAGKGIAPMNRPEEGSSGVVWHKRFIPDEEAIDLFQSCSLVVLPYVDGTQSALIASAYYFRKPVLVTNVGALGEYVEQGITGRIVPPGDARVMGEVLREMLLDKAMLRQMGDNGREWYDRRRVHESQLIDSFFDRWNPHMMSQVVEST